MTCINDIRSQFPILKRKINGYPLVYFDSGATSLKPQTVIDKVNHYYSMQSSNVHRSAHLLAEESTSQYEKTRDIVQNFLNAKEREEIIFTSGTTEAINLVARVLGDHGVPKNAEILISMMEHHSNIVPWQMLAQRTGAKIVVIPVTKTGEIDLMAYEKLLNENTFLVSITAVSNTLGTINPVEKIVKLAKDYDALTFVDAAQAAQHAPIDVRKLACDFLAFSGHKTFGPTGVGVLYGRKSLLQILPPFMGGGDMIDKVSFEKTSYNDLPYKFEAGTPKIASVIALKEGLSFLTSLGSKFIHDHENKLKTKFEAMASEVPEMTIIGTAAHKIPTFSFLIKGVHASDYTSYLTQKGIAIRVGHHCTQPLLQSLGVDALSRASLSIYNTEEEIEFFFQELKKAITFFTPSS